MKKILYAFLLIQLVACASVSRSPTVTISDGQLLGAVVDQVAVFKGIPYAAPPVGDLRWQPTAPVKSWSGARAAQEYGYFCPQKNTPLLWFELGEMSEDCLTLNVWSPNLASEKPLPVMVWIHGGGYLNGSGNIPRLNSPALAREGVVLVTINYRLNVFGFFAHPALDGVTEQAPVGNYGLMDVMASLQWVEKNIAQFGGDASNVTIFGESAGASLVNYLLIMPDAEGLFDKAISQSSAVGIVPDTHISKRVGFKPSAYKVAQKYVKALGLQDEDDVGQALRRLSAGQLLAGIDDRMVFPPMVEGDLIPDHSAKLFAAGKQHAVPFLNGGNSWEASLGRQIGGGFSPDVMAKLVTKKNREKLYPSLQGEILADTIFGDMIILSGARYVADHMVNSGQPVYHYHFSYVAKARRDTQPGAAHADDIAFAMKTLEIELDAVAKADRTVSDLMSAYWVEFARSGSPNRAGLPHWVQYSKTAGNVLEIGDSVEQHGHFLQDRMDYHQSSALKLLDRFTK